MIEKFSEEELRQIAKELQASGIRVNDYQKTEFIHEQLAKKGYTTYSEIKKVCGDEDVRKAILTLADFCIDNYEEVTRADGIKYRKRKSTVSVANADRYSRVVSCILEVLISEKER